MTSNAKKELIARETRAKFPYLIEITHYATVEDTTGTVYRFANSKDDITFEDNVYSSSVFSITPPERKQDSISDTTISISAIDQTWINRIRSTPVKAKHSKIRFVAVIQYENNGIETVEPIEDIEFELTKANWGDISISWTMEFDNLQDVQVPSETIDERICPALA